VPGRRVCLATAAVSLWHLLSAPRVPLCVFVCVFCFFAAGLGLALQAPGAHLHMFCVHVATALSSPFHVSNSRRLQETLADGPGAIPRGP